MTTGVDSVLSSVEDLFKTTVWDPFVATEETALFAAAPILAAPILGTIDREVIKLVSNYLFDQIRLVIDLNAIVFKNAAHQAAWDQASLKLKIVESSSSSTPEQIQEAKDAAALALSRFVRFSV